MTDEEAREKSCPFMPWFKGEPPNCRGSDCAVWQWDAVSTANLVERIKKHRAEFGSSLYDGSDLVLKTGRCGMTRA